MEDTAAITWTAVVTAVGTGATAFIVFVGLVLAVFQVRSMDKARELEALTSRSERWDGPSFVEARKAVSNIGDARLLWNHLDALTPGKSDEWFMYMRLPHFFEDMGIACLRAKTANKESVYELFASAIELYWGWYATFFKEFRVKQGDDRLFEWFEKLSNEMQQIKATKERRRR